MGAVKDNRIFRVTKERYGGRTTVQYKNRTAVSAMFARGSYGNSKRPDILKVEAIDPVEIPWTDVTDEFRNKPEPEGCPYHRTYTGVRRPAFWTWDAKDYVARYLSGCTCWKLYAEKHPEYPVHDPLCGPKHTDPATCPCQVLVKLTE